MIIGKIKDLGRYKNISPSVKQAIEWIQNTDLLSLPAGKTEIKGSEIYCNRSSYVGKELNDCVAENHNFYIDVQIVIKGKEGIGYADISNPTLKVKIPYNEVKDATKYDVEDEFVYILEDMSYALVYPEDIHKPLIKANDQIIEKAVVKIKID